MLIVFYQRFISPYKGFRCAHAALHHGDSCSQAVKNIIHEHGLLKSRTLIKRRFKSCRQAYETLQVQRDSDDKNKKGRCRDHIDLCNVADCFPSKGCGGKSTPEGPDADCDLPCDCGF